MFDDPQSPSASPDAGVPSAVPADARPADAAEGAPAVDDPTEGEADVFETIMAEILRHPWAGRGAGPLHLTDDDFEFKLGVTRALEVERLAQSGAAPAPGPAHAPIDAATFSALARGAAAGEDPRLLVRVDAHGRAAGELLAASLAHRLGGAAAVTVAEPGTGSRAENLLRHGEGVTAADLVRVSSVLGMPALAAVPDPSLPPRVVHVVLRAALGKKPAQFTVYTTAPRRAVQVAEALMPLAAGGPPPTIQIVERDSAPLCIRYGSADPALVEATRTLVGAVGASVRAERLFSPDDDDLFLTVVAPAGASVWSEVPVVLVSDAPRSESVASIQGFLEAHGASVTVEAAPAEAAGGMVSGFELAEGVSSAYGAEALDPLVAQISDAMAAYGLDPVRHTLRRCAGIDGPTSRAGRRGGGAPSAAFAPELSAASGNPRSAARLSIRVWLPFRAAADGRLRPNAEGSPAAWMVRLHGPAAATDGIGEALRSAGFEVERASCWPEADRPWLSLPEAEPDGRVRDLLDGILDTHLGGRPPMATWVESPARCVTLCVPGPLSPADQQRRLQRLHGRFAVSIRHGGADRPGLRALTERLRSAGFRVMERHEREWCAYEAKVGGAPTAVIDAISSAVGEVFPALGGARPEVERVWPARDTDIYIQLPESAAEPTAVGDVAPAAARPVEVDPFAAWLQPAGAAAPAVPFLRPDGAGGVWVGRVRLPGFALASAAGPETDGWAIDAGAAEVLDVIASGVARSEPVLLEGLTATSKTSAIVYLGARLGVEVIRVNLSGHTDTTELIGRYLPAPGGGWAWCDGAVVRALRAGAWLVLDELNLAEPATLERLNSLLEAVPTLRLTEHDGERFGPGGTPVHARFRVFATMNPATYGGRTELSPALRDRFIGAVSAPLPGEAALRQMAARVVTGAAVQLSFRGAAYTDPPVAALAPWPAEAIHPSERDAAIQRLSRLFSGLLALSAAPADDPQDPPPVWSRRGFLSLLRGLSAALHAGIAFEPALQQELLRAVVSRAGTAARRRAVAALLDANQLGPTCWAPRAAMV